MLNTIKLSYKHDAGNDEVNVVHDTYKHDAEHDEVDVQT